MDSRFESEGSYTADRAAALSGVPKSTIHHWARHEVLVPSVSRAKVKLWSFRDLLSLRLIHWLRHPKLDVAPSSMKTVRAALRQLRDLDMDLFDHDYAPVVSVDRGGRIYVNRHPWQPDGQMVAAELLDLIKPFELAPDLLSPSNYVRIRPRKLSGAPHVTQTRIESFALHTLRERGFTPEGIARLYPSLDMAQINDALALESRLARSLSIAA